MPAQQWESAYQFKMAKHKGMSNAISPFLLRNNRTGGLSVRPFWNADQTE
jgi:hypothetical protein